MLDEIIIIRLDLVASKFYLNWQIGSQLKNLFGGKKMVKKEDISKQLKGGLVVSCQALENEPLHSSFIMARMARAAKEAGAVGIRANSVVDVQAIMDTVELPVIGIIKSVYEESDVFITPTLKEVRQIAATGVPIIAMDGTQRRRPKDEKLEEIVKIIREEYPETLLMADTATLKDISYANSLGFDFIGTTLYGYTEETKGENIAKNDFEQMKEVLKTATVPVIAEGKIDTPEKAKEALALGCHCIVSGGAITRPQEIAKRFVNALQEEA